MHTKSLNIKNGWKFGTKKWINLKAKLGALTWKAQTKLGFGVDKVIMKLFIFIAVSVVYGAFLVSVAPHWPAPGWGYAALAMVAALLLFGLVINRLIVHECDFVQLGFGQGRVCNKCGKVEGEPKRQMFGNSKSLAVLAVVCLAGCSSLRDMPPSEYAWQGLHAIDTMQTLTIADNTHCMHEADPVTRLIIGENPERDRVYKWAVGNAVLHFLVFRWLDDKAPRTSKVLRAIDLGGKGFTVGRNYEQGIGIGGRSRWIDGHCNTTESQQGFRFNL